MRPWANAKWARGTCTAGGSNALLQRSADVEFLAPAKVNLSLRVLRRRDDGFHDIESLVCPLSIFDTVEITLRDEPGFDFTCDDPTVPTGDDNLVVRAAKLFCQSCGLEPHLRIALSKRIPHGAGLGGGSSDAATTLIGLNRLFQTELSSEALSAMAADLGSDVPCSSTNPPRSSADVASTCEPVGFSARAASSSSSNRPSACPPPGRYRRWRAFRRKFPGVSILRAGISLGFPWSTTSNGRSSRNTSSSPNLNRGCWSATGGRRRFDVRLRCDGVRVAPREEWRRIAGSADRQRIRHESVVLSVRDSWLASAPILPSASVLITSDHVRVDL